jgi:phospholipid/cholesterol/gamma-HCH transport system substrate-binding protein
MKPMAALWRLGISVVVTIFLIVVVSNVITQPVATNMRSYTAAFTDASGLHLDADVRVRGVRVGKITSIDLSRQSGQSVAVVGFTLGTGQGIVSTSRLAIKYQALTGVRYLEVLNPAEKYSTADLVMKVPTAMTQPSFDITALFNGLQPVIATLNPDEINTFTANAASFLSGDGAGLGTMLESLRRLTEFVSDRQQVVATLMRNLAAVAGTISGESPKFIQLLKWAERPLDGALEALDEFRKSQLYGPGFTEPTLRLVNSLGVKPGIDPDTALDRAATNLNNAMDAFKLIPVMWESIPPPAPDGTPEPCSHGRAQLPTTLDVFLNGQRVMLCNK